MSCQWLGLCIIILVNFLANFCKTTTWNDQILGMLYFTERELRRLIFRIFF